MNEELDEVANRLAIAYPVTRSEVRQYLRIVPNSIVVEALCQIRKAGYTHASCVDMVLSLRACHK